MVEKLAHSTQLGFKHPSPTQLRKSDFRVHVHNHYFMLLKMRDPLRPHPSFWVARLFWTKLMSLHIFEPCGFIIFVFSMHLSFDYHQRALLLWSILNIVVWEKTFESPLGSKKIKPVNPKWDKPWIFIGRPNAELKIWYLSQLMTRIESLKKIVILGKIEGRRHRGGRG